MRIGVLLVCIAAMAIPVVRAARGTHAQAPFATAFAHEVLPDFTTAEPNDGASVVVVEGLCGGLGGKTYNWQDVATYTDTYINAHRPTITEISPQGPGDCGGATLQDYESMISEIYTNVEGSTTDAATWWGGFMLDEEPQDDFGWSDNPDVSAAFYEALNSFVHDLMGNANGLPYYYTELATPPGWWLGPAFTSIIGNSDPAPAIANEATLKLTNYFQTSMHEAILATWSLDPGYSIRGLIYSATRVQGSPFTEWGMNLSNCWIHYFVPIQSQRCNDWDADGILNASDTDSDNDHCPDVDEPAHGLDPLDPWDFYSVPVRALRIDPSGVTDSGVGVTTDVLALLSYVGRGPTSPDYTADVDHNGIEDGLQYDRSDLVTEPGPPDGGIGSSSDVIAMEREGGLVCLD